MHAVTGIYAKAIFCDELNLPYSCLRSCIPSPDFNQGHPDPNLTYAKELYDLMVPNGPDLGAASDGDGDRNMILGKNHTFVSPSDSLAIIAHYADLAIPYFRKHKITGVARSMPTSRAVDRVAEKRGLPCYQTPTGWKYFGNLMDAGKVNLCGEESFGTGSNHIREKDGIWAVLCWLSILAYVNRNAVASVKDILEQHWNTYGRHFYRRCDYEECDSIAANAMFEHLRHFVKSGHGGLELQPGWKVSSAEEYRYVDPVDGSVAENQGIIICFDNGSRIVYRLSGTGSAGATIRVYMEYFALDWTNINENLEDGPLMQIALEISNLSQFTGRHNPNVIT